MLTRKDITYNHLINFRGNDGKINNKDCRFLITENDDNEENHLDYKNIITNELLKQGDYISLDNSNYMVIDKTNVLESSYSIGVLRKTLSIQLGTTLKKVEAIVDKNRTVLNDTGEIVDVHDQYTFIVPSIDGNGKSNNVALSQIIYDGGLYNIISIDTSREGLIIYIGKFSAEYNPHLYSISLSETTTTIVEGGTYQISGITCTDNGEIVKNPQLTYLSSDENIANVSDSGLVTGVGVGDAEITVSYNRVSEKLSLLVNARPVEPVISYSYTLSNGVSLRLAEATTITCVKTISGVEDTSFTGSSLAYNFDSIGQSALSAGKITVTKGTIVPTIQVRNKQTSSDTLKTIHVTITDSATGIIIVDNLSITIKNSTT